MHAVFFFTRIARMCSDRRQRPECAFGLASIICDYAIPEPTEITKVLAHANMMVDRKLIVLPNDRLCYLLCADVSNRCTSLTTLDIGRSHCRTRLTTPPTTLSTPPHSFQTGTYAKSCTHLTHTDVCVCVFFVCECVRSIAEYTVQT